MKVKTIDVTGKEWFDKVNGNSYFSAKVCINFNMKDEHSFNIPFEYGYGDSYLHAAHSELIKRGFIKDKNNNMRLFSYCFENGITLRHNKIKNCKKRDVVAYGMD